MNYYQPGPPRIYPVVIETAPVGTGNERAMMLFCYTIVAFLRPLCCLIYFAEKHIICNMYPDLYTE